MIPINTGMARRSQMPTLTRRAIPSESARVRHRRGRSPCSTNRLDRRNCSTPIKPVASMTRVESDPHNQNHGSKVHHGIER